MNTQKTNQTITTPEARILIIGAGPSGLTAANVLACSGVNVRILDKKAGPTDQTRALVVHAKTLELFDKLGLADSAVEDGRRLTAAQLLSEGKGAKNISFVDTGAGERTPYPFALSYAQSQTERSLLQNFERTGGRVEWETELLSLAQTESDVQVLVRRASGKEETLTAEWVIGADGAHSPVRRLLSLGFAGKPYEQTLFLADVDVASALEGQQVSFDLTQLGFNGFFGMPGDTRRFRLLGSLSPELTNKDELTERDVQHLLDTTSTLPVEIQQARWISVYRIHHRMAERFRVGRVFLVGDAAHIHSPAGGQGMNTGIGDAYNLAWKIALVVKGQARETLLDSYEAERMPFAHAILSGSDRAFILAVTTNPLGRRLKLVAVPLLVRILSLLPALKRRAFWYLSQLWTSYRNSPVVADTEPKKKKGLRAGDRAPYGLFESGPDAGESLFSRLRGIDHHLLFFAGNTSNQQDADLNVTSERLQAVLDRYDVPIHLHVIPTENRSLHEQYRADKPSLFLIRPDGHLAYRGLAGNTDSLRSYLDGWFHKQEPAASS